MDIKLKVTKLVSRAMEDTRGLDYKYPNEEDAEDLADTLNSILDHTVKQLLAEMGEKNIDDQNKDCALVFNGYPDNTFTCINCKKVFNSITGNCKKK